MFLCILKFKYLISLILAIILRASIYIFDLFIESRMRKRRRVSETIDIEYRLESLITKVGEKVIDKQKAIKLCLA